MAFLPVEKNVVTQLRDVFERKHVVVYFGFLQPNNIWLVLCHDGFQLVWSCTQSIDIKRDKLHRSAPP
jgi:hypothetical protein